jgi:hypothetical protein
MTRTPPHYITAAGVVAAPINYKWNNDLALKFFAAKDMNIRLFEAIDASNFKAKMAIGTAVTEWIVWRFEGQADLKNAHQRLDAAWASVIHPLYVKDLSVNLTKDHDKEPVEGPLEIAMYLLGKTEGRYADGIIFLAAPIVNQSMLARHLMPDKKVFDGWLSATLRRAAKAFPRGPQYDRRMEKYDGSGEKPVPREFFDPGFEYTDVAVEQALRAFLKSLDAKKNPYLRSAKEMKAEGFDGEPYTI